MVGVKVSHSTLQRLVQRTEFELPDAKQKVAEVSFDGGKVRLRSEQKGQPSYWLEYKSARLQGIYYGAAFRNNPFLLDWVNSQSLCTPLVCLGDGHDGVWKFFTEVAGSEQRLEIQGLVSPQGKSLQSWWLFKAVAPSRGFALARFSRSSQGAVRRLHPGTSSQILPVSRAASLLALLTMRISRPRGFPLALEP